VHQNHNQELIKICRILVQEPSLQKTGKIAKANVMVVDLTSFNRVTPQLKEFVETLKLYQEMARARQEAPIYIAVIPGEELNASDVGLEDRAQVNSLAALMQDLLQRQQIGIGYMTLFGSEAGIEKIEQALPEMHEPIIFIDLKALLEEGRVILKGSGAHSYLDPLALQQKGQFEEKGNEMLEFLIPVSEPNISLSSTLEHQVLSLLTLLQQQ
jgi:hypothetical protein